MIPEGKRTIVKWLKYCSNLSVCVLVRSRWLGLGGVESSGGSSRFFQLFHFCTTTHSSCAEVSKTADGHVGCLLNFTVFYCLPLFIYCLCIHWSVFYCLLLCLVLTGAVCPLLYQTVMSSNVLHSTVILCTLLSCLLLSSTNLFCVLICISLSTAVSFCPLLWHNELNCI